MNTRRVLSLAGPVMVSMFSYALMNAADAVFVGRQGTVPLAAIGLAITVVWLFLALPHGLMRGLKVATSQAVGAGRQEVADDLGWQAIWLALGTGFVVALGANYGTQVFLALGATQDVAATADLYFRIRALAAPIALLSLGLTGWFEGRGDTKTPARVNVAVNVINIALDAVLVPRMGIAGAAWAGVLSLSLAAVWQLVAAAPILRRSFAGIHRELLVESLRLGMPIGVQRLLDVFAWTVLSGVIASCGDHHLAAHVLAIRILLVSFLPGFAIAEATAVLVGQSVGARRPDQARAAWRAGVTSAVVVMAVGGLVFVLFPSWLLAPFGAGADVLPVARQLLWVAAAFQIIDGIATVTYFCLDGAGDTRFTLISSISMSFGLKLPLGWALARFTTLGAVGAWLGLTAELVALVFVLGWRWRSGRWYAPDRLIAASTGSASSAVARDERGEANPQRSSG